MFSYLYNVKMSFEYVSYNVDIMLKENSRLSVVVTNGRCLFHNIKTQLLADNNADLIVLTDKRVDPQLLSIMHITVTWSSSI